MSRRLTVPACGWPTAPKLEALRTEWFVAPDLAAQRKMCATIQAQAFDDVPFIPTGVYYDTTAYRGLAGVRTGFPQFYDVHPV